MNNFKLKVLVSMISAAFAFTACGGKVNEQSSSSSANQASSAASRLPVIEAVLTQAPNVPPPVARNYAAKVVVNMETQEKVMRMADGVDYMFWTFGGQVTGQFMRIRDGYDLQFNK
jgi:nitrite reductase (NO-forming)